MTKKEFKTIEERIDSLEESQVEQKDMLHALKKEGAETKEILMNMQKGQVSILSILSTMNQKDSEQDHELKDLKKIVDERVAELQPQVNAEAKNAGSKMSAAIAGIFIALYEIAHKIGIL